MSQHEWTGYPPKCDIFRHLSKYGSTKNNLPDMVPGKVRCAKKREVLIEELKKLKEELASLEVAKVIHGH